MAYFFISHGTEQYAAAKQLADYMVKSGYDVWHVTEAEQMTAVWREGIDDCVAVLVLMSPELHKNKPAEEERKFIAKLRKPVIPVLLAGTPFSEYLSLPHVDMQKGDIPEHALVAFLRMHIPNPSGQGKVIQPTPDDHDETETKPANDMTAMAKPKHMQDLMKALRDGMGSQPKRSPDMVEKIEKATGKLEERTKSTGQLPDESSAPPKS